MNRQGSRIMMFVSGPPTVGQGMIVSRDKTETIRSHTDLQKNAAPHFKAASKVRSGKKIPIIFLGLYCCRMQSTFVLVL